MAKSAGEPKKKRRKGNKGQTDGADDDSKKKEDGEECDGEPKKKEDDDQPAKKRKRRKGKKGKKDGANDEDFISPHPSRKLGTTTQANVHCSFVLKHTRFAIHHPIPQRHHTNGHQPPLP